MEIINELIAIGKNKILFNFIKKFLGGRSTNELKILKSSVKIFVIFVFFHIGLSLKKIIMKSNATYLNLIREFGKYNKIQITATIFVYHFVYPNGMHIKKCMHANELDRLWW